jgi:hypothetical protein
MRRRRNKKKMEEEISLFLIISYHNNNEPFCVSQTFLSPPQSWWGKRFVCCSREGGWWWWINTCTLTGNDILYGNLRWNTSIFGVWEEINEAVIQQQHRVSLFLRLPLCVCYVTSHGRSGEGIYSTASTRAVTTQRERGGG